MAVILPHSQQPLSEATKQATLDAERLKLQAALSAHPGSLAKGQKAGVAHLSLPRPETQIFSGFPWEKRASFFAWLTSKGTPSPKK